VSTSAFVLGSILETEPLSTFATQIALMPAASALGPVRMGTWAIGFPVRASKAPTESGDTAAVAESGPAAVSSTTAAVVAAAAAIAAQPSTTMSRCFRTLGGAPRPTVPRDSHS
jgi:hypothetical protein